ncbi:hypothetical protein MTX78_02240 [Hymenobacter tibetensis]|uniref:Lipocalin-like domain-containing protein n=1 Tax=Hymenobacter tibetensis TaxID=497967 RepID=A0ABY4CYS7_9BACT|nr:hypothetical protein [Hymenobacter tibetensis]UOG75425.1 hypothetical protein MTX78_02240 [Hymenobacter tibetensis]
MKKHWIRAVFLLVLAAWGCTTPAVPPESVYGAPAAVIYSEGRFSGEWYRHSDGQPCLTVLSIGHDTLSRYNINEIGCHNLASIEAYTGYATGDFLHVFGVPEHHSPELWFHFEAGRQRLLLTYQPVGVGGLPRPAMVRDTFWLDSTRVTGRAR